MAFLGFMGDLRCGGRGGVMYTMVVDGWVGVFLLTRRVGAMHLLSRFQSLES